MMLNIRYRKLLQVLLRQGAQSRSQLHTQLGLRKNTVGSDVEALIQERIVRESGTQNPPRGRPHVHIEIDPAQRHVLGLSLLPNNAELTRTNLLGETSKVLDKVDPCIRVIADAAWMLRRQLKPEVVAIGLALPGYMDPQRKTLLFSSLFGGGGPVDLTPLYEVAGETPIVIGNIATASAASWMLKVRPPATEDILAVYLDKGQIGACFLVQGRPNPGCITGANEIGHMRMAVPTRKCYCGQTGCLERIFDTPFINTGGRDTRLPAALEQFDGKDEAVVRMIDLVANGLANAVNFARPHRLVLISPFAGYLLFKETLTTAIRKLLLRELASRVAIEWHSANDPANTPAATALALASIYYEGWEQPEAEQSKKPG